MSDDLLYSRVNKEPHITTERIDINYLLNFVPPIISSTLRDSISVCLSEFRSINSNCALRYSGKAVADLYPSIVHETIFISTIFIQQSTCL